MKSEDEDSEINSAFQFVLAGFQGGSLRPAANGGAPLREAQKADVLVRHKVGRYLRPGLSSGELLLSQMSTTKDTKTRQTIHLQVLPDLTNRTTALLQMPQGRYQFLRKLLPLLGNQSEDCLTLNIYVPGSGKCFLYLGIIIQMENSVTYRKSFGFQRQEKDRTPTIS